MAQRLIAPTNLQPGLVSIGVPVYNGAKYLRGALDALLDQDYRDLEIIISDNASEDGTEAICREFAARDNRIRYYRAEKNQGPFWNYVYVYEIARGEYFMWAAHDDLRHPQNVSRCVAELERNPRALFCCTGVKFIDADGRDITEACRLKSFRPVGDTPSARMRALGKSTFLLDIYSLFRTPELAKTSLGRQVWGGDLLLTTELCLRGEVALAPEQLFFYRYLNEKTHEDMAYGLDPSGAMSLSWILLTIEVLKAIGRAPLGILERIKVAWAFSTEFSIRNIVINDCIRQEGFSGVRNEFSQRRYGQAFVMALLRILLLPTPLLRRIWTSARFRFARFERSS
jgi:glycosyltransferase involved in cell wall biosynthesis